MEHSPAFLRQQTSCIVGDKQKAVFSVQMTVVTSAIASASCLSILNYNDLLLLSFTRSCCRYIVLRLIWKIWAKKTWMIVKGYGSIAYVEDRAAACFNSSLVFMCFCVCFTWVFL